MKVYADFHESKVVLVMSHGQKCTLSFYVKRHHIDIELLKGTVGNTVYYNYT